MARKQPKKRRLANKPSEPQRTEPKGIAEVLFAWSEKHGYWKTLLALVILIFTYFLAKNLFP